MQAAIAGGQLGLVPLQVTQVRLGRLGVVEGDVRLGEAQRADQAIGVGLDLVLEQLEAGLGVAVGDQARRCEHVERAEHAGRGALAIVGIRGAHAAGVLLGLGDETHRLQAAVLGEATGDRGRKPEPMAMYDSDMKVYLGTGKKDNPELRRNIELNKKWAGEGK